MNELVSIIIPVYNSEEYIEKCLKSVDSQTYSNIEVIIINDGSIDKSLEVIKKYRFRKAKKIVIDKENEGVSIARNIGIKNAQGKYIFFLDSDDCIVENTIDYLITCMEKYKCDGIRGNYLIVKGNQKCLLSENIKHKLYKDEEMDEFRGAVISNSIRGFSCNIIFLREIIDINNISYPTDMNFMEDFVFLMEYLRYAKSFFISELCTYMYYQNDNTSSRTYDISKRLNNIAKRKSYCEEYIKKNPILKKYYKELGKVIAEIYIKTEKYILINSLDCSSYDYKEVNRKLLREVEHLLKEYNVKIRELDFQCMIIILLLKLRLDFVIIYFMKLRKYESLRGRNKFAIKKNN